jgi:hypothetical protein
MWDELQCFRGWYGDTETGCEAGKMRPKIPLARVLGLVRAGSDERETSALELTCQPRP